MGDTKLKSFKTSELLYKLDKSSYESLKNDTASNMSYIFNLGRNLGNEDEARDIDLDGYKEEIKVRSKLAKDTLDKIIDNSKKFTLKIKEKIKGYKRIELIFQILTALGGSALLLTLVNKFEDSPKVHFSLQLAGASIATIGSLLSVFLNKGLGGWNFNRRNRVEDYDNLVLSNIQASRLLRKLIPKLMIFDSLSEFDELESIINETEDLSEKIGKIIPDYS